MRRPSQVSLGWLTLVVLVTIPFAAVQASSIGNESRRHNARGFDAWIAAPLNFPSMLSPSSPDNWLGGMGNWSNGADWSAGEPGGSSDVSINTGNDVVTLDTNANINSLTLGGTSGSSTLQENLARGFIINVAGALTINQTGTLTLRQDAVFANADSTNAGTINFFNEAQLQVNAGFTNTGMINLNSASGLFANSLNNSGSITGLGTFSLVMISGDVNNSGTMFADEVLANGTVTNQASGGISANNLVVGGNLANQGLVSGLARGSQLTVDGQLTNGGRFDFTYANATLGSLNNLTGGLVVGGGMLTINGNTSNAGGIVIMALGPNEPMVDVQINGSVTNSGGIGVSGPSAYERASISGSVVNSGGISVEDGGVLGVGGNLTNSGMIVTGGQNQPGGNSFGAASLTNLNGGVLSVGSIGDVVGFGHINNAGSISIANGATLQIATTNSPTTALPGFLNSGTVLISSGGTLFSPLTYAQTGGQTTVDGTLHVGGHGVVNLAGGSLYGNNGTIQGNVISNANFNIGDTLMTPGQMSIMGNYTQGANGALTFDIASLTQYDRLNVSGQATLNGLMTVDLLNGYIPQVGNMFDIMNFASRSGTFSMVLGLPINNQEHFVLEYNSTNLTLDVVAGPSLEASSGRIGPHNDRIVVVSNNEPFVTQTMEALDLAGSYSSGGSSVPEPGSILLFGSGVAGIATLLRRRRTT